MSKLKNKKIDSGTTDIHQDDNKHVTKYFTFKVGRESYGIEVKNVREVIEYEKIFKIPQVPVYVKGVINLRGEIVSVIDMPQHFYYQSSEITVNTSIVIVEQNYNYENVLIGMLIDEIEAVVNIDNKNISNIPEFGSKLKHEYIHKIGKVDDHFIVLLNLDNVLNIEEIAQLKK